MRLHQFGHQIRHCWCFDPRTKSIKTHVRHLHHLQHSAKWRQNISGVLLSQHREFADVQGANCSCRKWHWVTRLAETAHHMAQDKSAHWPRDSTFKRGRMIASAACVWVWFLARKNATSKIWWSYFRRFRGNEAKETLRKYEPLFLKYVLHEIWYHMIWLPWR